MNLKIGIRWNTNNNPSILPSGSGSQNSQMSGLSTIPQNSSTLIPAPEPSLTLGGSSSSSLPHDIPPLTSSVFGAGLFTTITTSYPTTVTQPSTTFTSFSQTVVTSPISTSTPSLPQSGQSAFQTQAVCLGNGLDASADGLIASMLIPSAIGLLLWVCLNCINLSFAHS
jgi:calcium permeable stress-gated cation channel